MGAESPVRLTHGDYTIGWVCALPKEQTAALYMLEAKHEDLPNPINDHNAYYLGSIGQHNIVIACLPMGRTGNNNSAVVATRMISTFPNIKIGLMVGVGGGVPPNVRLGDIVVSCATSGYPGVIQWDMGKTEKGGQFKRTGSLGNPSTALLTAMSKFNTDPTESRAMMLKHLADFKLRKPDFVPSDLLKDVLYKSSYSHISRSCSLDADAWEEELEAGEENCNLCDESKILQRPLRSNMMVHYGLIASGNQVVKDAPLRNKLNRDFEGKLLCLEMEAAGLMNDFPCIVIRGICDYADSHKNKSWQEHAAAVAAVYAKVLIKMLPVSDINRMQTIRDFPSPALMKAAEDRKDEHNLPTSSFERSQVTNDSLPLLPSESSSAEQQPSGFQKVNLTRVSIRLFEDKKWNELEEQWLIEQLEKKSNRFMQLETELTKVEDEIRKFEERRRELMEEKMIADGEIRLLHKRQGNVKKRQNHVSTQWASTQRQLDEILHFDSSEHEYEHEFSHMQGWTLLQWATERGHAEMVKLLLDESVDIATQDYNGWTPLILASRNGYADVVRLFLDTGRVHIDWKENGQRTALEWAVKEGHEDVAQLLLERGANADCIRTFGDHDVEFFSVAFSHDSQIIASASEYPTIKLWDVATGQCRQTLKGHTDSVLSVGFSHNSRSLSSASMDKRIKFWDVATGQCQLTVKGHTEPILSVSYSHDSIFVISASVDKTIMLWNATTGQCLSRLGGHADSVISVAFSHDSRFIASASDDKTIKIWNATTGQCQHTLDGHVGPVTSVRFSNNSRVLASASEDGTMKLWDLETGRCQQTLRGHTDGVVSVAFSHDSTMVVSASSDNTIKLWDTVASLVLVCRENRRNSSTL